MNGENQIVCGDALGVLRGMPDQSVHCCVTSPPYWGLRSYLPEDHSDKKMELGCEKTPEEYVERLVEIFREVKRVLRDDGTLFLNLGDSYYAGGWECRRRNVIGADSMNPADRASGKYAPGLKPKDLVGIPWRVAFALQAEEWYLRSEIIWVKTNPMPESVTDRPTKSHEHIFLLAKSKKYYYDQRAIKESAAYGIPNSPGSIKSPYGQGFTRRAKKTGKGATFAPRQSQGIQPGHMAQKRLGRNKEYNGSSRNKRDVWTIATRPFKEAHFAVYPPDLIRPCIRAGSSERGCCPECGAPWERVVETKYHIHEHWFGDKQTARHSRGSQGQSYKEPVGSETLGWRPTCNHYPQVDQWLEYPRQGKDESDEAYEGRCKPIRQERQRLLDLWAPLDSISCTVLDPFFGAGTTGVVAKQEGRRYIGIELNGEYVEMARKRINSECPMDRLL